MDFAGVLHKVPAELAGLKFALCQALNQGHFEIIFHQIV